MEELSSTVQENAGTADQTNSKAVEVREVGDLYVGCGVYKNLVLT